MSSSCTVDTCQNDCCNYYGSCTYDYDSSYTSLYTRCYYYYDSTTTTTTDDFPYWALGPIIFGVIFFACCAFSIYKSKQAQNQSQMEVVENNTGGNQQIIVVEQPQNNYGNQYDPNYGNQYPPTYQNQYDPAYGQQQPYVNNGPIQQQPYQQQQPNGLFGMAAMGAQQQNGQVMY